MHPIHKLLEAGVHVTVNSDNRTCSRTTLQKEKEVLKEELGFTDEEIEKMIADRQQARKDRNFALADEIRQKLLDMGIILEDTREGVKWKRA